MEEVRGIQWDLYLGFGYLLAAMSSHNHKWHVNHFLEPSHNVTVT